MHLINMG